MAEKRPYLRRGPSGPRAEPFDVGIVQVGYDQAVEGFTVPPAAMGAAFPRNIAGDPVKVVLPDVAPGNTLEVDWTANLIAALNAAYPLTFLWTAVAIVSFDGVDPAVGNANTFYVIDSWGSSLFASPDEQTADDQSISGLAAVEIPAGATTATVEIIYLTEGDVVVNKAVGLGFSLKVTEIGADHVSQPGPGVLLAS